MQQMRGRIARGTRRSAAGPGRAGAGRAWAPPGREPRFPGLAGPGRRSPGGTARREARPAGAGGGLQARPQAEPSAGPGWRGPNALPVSPSPLRAPAPAPGSQFPFAAGSERAAWAARRALLGGRKRCHTHSRFEKLTFSWRLETLI